MKLTHSHNVRLLFFVSLILFSMLTGFVGSPGNLATQQSADSGNGEGKPLSQPTPSYTTPGIVLYDDFSGSALGSDWATNPLATAKGATFSTATRPGYLTIYTPSTDPPFEQTASVDNGAYAYVTLQGKLASMSTFTLETKVNYTKVRSGGYQVGLMIRFQDNYHMYFWGPYGEWKGTPNIYLGFSGFSKLLGPTLPSFSETGTYYLRIVRNQSLYYFFASVNGVDWVYAGSHNPYGATGASGPPTAVGLIVKTQYDKKPYAEVTARFDYFKVTVEGQIKQATYPVTLYCGEVASIVGQMKYYHNASYVSSGKMGLIVDGNLDQVQTTDGSGTATFLKGYSSSGTHIFTLYPMNNTQYSLSPVVNKTFSITWIGYRVSALVLDADGQSISGVTVRLQNATTKEDVKTAQITNETGYCVFDGVKPSLIQDYLLNATLNIYGSVIVKNDTVVFEVTDHVYRELTMRTTKTLIHVSDTSVPPRPYQDVNVTFCETSAPYSMITSSVVNLTAWVSIYLDSTKFYNMSLWYGEPQVTLRIKEVNATTYGGLGIYWFTFAASHKQQFNVTAGGTAKAPTYLVWAAQPPATCYWDEIVDLNVSLSKSEGINDPIQAVWVNWSMGSLKGDFDLNLGNNTASIQARILGSITQGKGSASFVILIDANPYDSVTYAKPATIYLILTVKAVPLHPQYSASASAYWGYNATLWIELTDNRTSTPYELASFSVKIDGNPTDYKFMHASNGNYTLTNATAFGLAIGGHTFQIYLAIDNYTFVQGQSVLQMIVITLQVNYIPTNTLEVHVNMYDETGQSQLGSTNVYWRWAFELNVSYVSAVDQSPVSNAGVYIRFYKQTTFIVETIALYNSSEGAYFALLNSTNFPGNGIYTYSVTASREGHIPQTVLSYAVISWRLTSVQFSSDNYASLKGAFGGDSRTQIEVTLRDQLSGSLLTGAKVYYNWSYVQGIFIVGNFTEIDTGVYSAEIYAGQDVPVAVYDVRIIVNMTEHEPPQASVKMTVDFTGGHVELPIIGIVPTTLFAIILGSIAVVGSLGGFRAYVWITTPYLVKQINRVLHDVDKGVPTGQVSGLKSRVEKSLSLLRSELEYLGLSGQTAPVAKEELAEEDATVTEDSDKEQGPREHVDQSKDTGSSEKQAKGEQSSVSEKNQNEEKGG